MDCAFFINLASSFVGASMATLQTDKAGKMDVIIFERLLMHGKNNLPPTLARYLLELGFMPEERSRMHELAVKNQDGLLSPEEKEELEGYARAGCWLGILKSKARKSLKKIGRNGAS
jgi:hypothetical protein